MTNDFTQTIGSALHKALSNNAPEIINGFLFRFVMQIIHVVTTLRQSVKEPFTKQGYFYKMHIKYIIKMTHIRKLLCSTLKPSQR
ncbi:hypothetical protein DA718_07340 [Klebsiella huaxiensis]|nr:hypothetical protein DA718_07340 [Klebsiella huaxiensis]